jgi:hypothetical protein
MAAMSGYTKLFNSILASTVWREPMEVRIVWITLLAMADKDGIAEGSIPGLADFARIPVEATRKAIARLSAPDPDSRSQEHEGRRIQAVDGGWQLLNHAKYRAKMGADERREYNRLKQAQYRSRLNPSITVNDNVRCVDNTEAKAEAEAYTEPNNTKDAKASNVFKKPDLLAVQMYCMERGNTVDPQSFVDFYTSNGWKVGRNSMKDWKAAIRTWEKNRSNVNGKDTRTRAKRVSDRLDEIARRDIEKNGHTDKLG